MIQRLFALALRLNKSSLIRYPQNTAHCVKTEFYLKIYKLVVFLALLVMGSHSNVLAQGIETEFGKNRVQFHDFQWSFFESDNFIIYFYQGGQDLAKYSLSFAESNIDEMSYKLEYQMGSKIEILIYHNLSDLKQTNIGIGTEFNNVGGVTKIVGNKLFVYFNGDHEHLEQQILAGISGVILDNIVFGSNIQEVLQNAVLLNLPEWYTQGLIAYLSREWDDDIDEQVRKGVLDDRYRKFSKLRGDDAYYAGFSFWSYVVSQYGESVLPNIMYLTRVNRNVDSGFVFVIGKTLKELVQEWRDYTSALYFSETSNREAKNADDALVLVKNLKRDIRITEVALSPNGKQILYCVDDNGKYKVYLRDLENDNKEKLLKQGFRAFNLPNEGNYPLMAWSPKGNKLVLIYEKKDAIKYLLYDIGSGEEIVDDIPKFQQITDVAFDGTDRRLIFSAMSKGQMDLFTFRFTNQKTVQLTKDLYDDLDPVYYNDGEHRGIIFASNRQDDTLRMESTDTLVSYSDYDLFFYDYDQQSNVLIQLTDSPQADEREPTQYDPTHFGYLSDGNGIANLYAGKMNREQIGVDELVFFKDSVVVNPDFPIDSLLTSGAIDSVAQRPVYQTNVSNFYLTDQEKNIRDYSVSKKQLAEIVAWEKGIGLFVRDKIRTEGRTSSILKPTTFLVQKGYLTQRNTSEKVKEEEKEDLSLYEPSADSTDLVLPNGEIDINDYQFGEPESSDSESKEAVFFQSEFDVLDITDGEEQMAALAKEEEEKEKDIPVYKKSRVRVYSPRFATDYVVTQFDNSNILTPYQTYSLQPTGNFSTNIKGLTRVGISDLMEDYKIVAGFRMPFDFNQSEYYLEAQFLKKRLDKKYILYRRAKSSTYGLELVNPPFVDAKNLTYIGQATFNYPLQMVNAVRATVSYRNETLRVLSSTWPALNGTVDAALNQLDLSQDWFIAKLEYVYDDSDELLMNLRRGMRYKFYFEFFKPFDVDIVDGVDVNFNNTGHMMVTGFDFRHYQPLHNEIVWSNRFTAARSWGPTKMIYFLGGVENWIWEPDRFNQENQVDNSANYGFQSIAANLRGFKQNVRHGTAYALINSELRVPFFTYLFANPIKSDFFRNFQVIGFADVGTAWDGWNPFSDDNLFDTVIDSNGPVTVELDYFRQPVVAGYGVGFRSTLLGYYVKADYAWGWDGEVAADQIWYISLGLDF